jgi:hypothetical protein
MLSEMLTLVLITERIQQVQRWPPRAAKGAAIRLWPGCFARPRAAGRLGPLCASVLRRAAPRRAAVRTT